MHDPDPEGLMRLAAFYFDRLMRPKTPYLSERFPIPLIESKFVRDYHSDILQAALDEKHDQYKDWKTRDLLRECLASLPPSQNGRWSLIGTHPIIREKDDPVDTLYLELLGQFPVPDADVSFKDILRYHRRNREAVLEFRNSITGFANEIGSSKSSPHVRDLVADRISDKLESIDKSLSRGLKSKILDRFTIGINLPAAAANGLMTMFGVPPGVALPLSNALNVGCAKAPVSNKFLAPDCHYVHDAYAAGVLRSD